MQPVQIDHLRHSRLRLMYSDAVVSFNLASNVTFSEIARKLDELSVERHGSPLAIDVTLTRHGATDISARL